MAGSMAPPSARPDATNVAYVVGGQPVAVLSMSQPKSSWTRKPLSFIQIHALASHPGTEGAGGALLEHAVNCSQEAGLGGKVCLHALARAIPAYRAMGFKGSAFSESSMTLDPAKSDKWVQVEGRWRLAKHAGKAYAG